MLVFPVVKLLDFKTRTVELEASANPFALVVSAQLAATATKRDPAARLDRKIGLTRRLYRCGLSRDEVLSLYAFIDWVMTLPEPLEDDYHRAIQGEFRKPSCQGRRLCRAVRGTTKRRRCSAKLGGASETPSPSALLCSWR